MARTKRAQSQLSSAENVISLTEKERDLLKNENKQLHKQLKYVQRKAESSHELEAQVAVLKN